MRLSQRLAVWTCASAAACAVTAASADDFYKGKTVKLIVGSGEASGVDILGRVAARHLPKHISGQPVIVVQNMPAPESIAAANHVFNIAEPDGLTLGAGSSGLFSRAISQPNIRFDLSKFTWIANIYSATVIFWMRTDFPCQTFEQLRTCPQPIKFGATARGSTGYGLVPELLKDSLKLNMDIIYGYRNAQVDLAVERNEVQASGGDLIGFMGARPRQLMEEGKAKILLQVSGRKNPDLDKYNVAWSMDVVPDSHKPLFRMLNPILDLARPYFAPPNVPADRAKILRDAFGKLVGDQDFRAEMKKVAGITPSYVPGEEMAANIKDMLDQPPEVKDKIIGLLQGK
ncbi:MAG: Bug family tripartite tricarboxylate transporter substrate binding protein [Beijerinckiaceae bacterium]